MAIDVIRKDKKDIRWIGYEGNLMLSPATPGAVTLHPNASSHSLRHLHLEMTAVGKRLGEKRRGLGDLVTRYLCLKSLVARNSRSQEVQSLNGANSRRAGAIEDRLYLPFILISTRKECRVHCEMLEDRYSSSNQTNCLFLCFRSQYHFEFDSPFAIQDDIEVLRMMGSLAAGDGSTLLGSADVVRWLPRDLLAYCRSNDLLPRILSQPALSGPMLNDYTVMNNGRGLKSSPSHDGRNIRRKPNNTDSGLQSLRKSLFTNENMPPSNCTRK